ncbi:MAG: hypothetical protein M1817_000055 [Caeruleum heppii]|nr:MAG: hypothetical protein M1817_000055 [Caeruleum heppii]
MSTSIPDTTIVPEKVVQDDSSADDNLKASAKVSITDHQSVPENVQSFSPFFTILEDPSDHRYHLPTVYYVFSDDDTDLVTEACMRALVPTATSLKDGPHVADQESDLGSSGAAASALPFRREGVNERYLVLDMAGSGKSVRAAYSLSSNWQVSDVSISNAPTWENVDASPAGASGALMLTIKGTEGLRDAPAPMPLIEGTSDEILPQLIEGFERNMQHLRTVIKSGEDVISPP